MAERVLDGNSAVAEVAYRCSEVIAIYPITPASAMGELSDQWSADGVPNLWGEVPRVVEMQSEGGAAGTVHGSLQAGSLTTTFTCSQGLLLMIPNMFKIAGELTSTVFHIAARTVASHALSIFGDHSDVMAVRSTGWAMLFAGSVQEAHDFALISQMAALESRVPFLNVMDGFRTSHEECRIELLDEQTMRELLPADAISAHRRRALSPERPSIRGTAQNPDVFFQSREAANPYYAYCPGLTEHAMRRFAEKTGRLYELFQYAGHPEAERVVVVMGSAGQTVQETVEWLCSRGEKVGVLKVRLFRPFAAEKMVAALPESATRVAVLDRCRESGALGEPLFQDTIAALAESGRRVKVIGGRYGLASKEFTPAMAAAVFGELAQPSPRPRFTVGIQDDVGGLSLTVDPDLVLEDPQSVRAVFWGLGADGTVGANKNSIRIIGEETGCYAQGYFVYDSKKSGARTISHLRFGPRPIAKPYLIQRANFIAIHQFEFIHRYPVLSNAEEGAVVLLNSPFPAEEVWQRLPAAFQAELHARRLKLYVIDADRIAREFGLGGRINTTMQTCFFELSGVVPLERAAVLIKDAILNSYSKQGEPIVRRNFAAVDAAIGELREVPLGPPPALVPAPTPFADLAEALVAGLGEEQPVSHFSPDGTYPTNTAHLEKRRLADRVPHWLEQHCIQCGKCVFVCPHSAIRAKLVEARELEEAPAGLPSLKSAFKEFPDHRYVLQVSEDDCTGCRLCAEICPTKEKSLVMGEPREHTDWDFFLSLSEDAPGPLRWTSVKNVQLRQPLFEFSGACAGCGETPYLRLLSQLYGDHLMVANATGCSSIYGGNLPTTPWSKNREGYGPAWSNSLFEDNAEFGLGMRLALDQQALYARRLHRELLGKEWPENLDIQSARAAVRALCSRVKGQSQAELDLLSVAHALVPHTVWLVGGDGWAYDIGYGGLDHVLSGQARVRVLVLDTEVYSNTGGQASKSTPFGAVAKFAAAGKPTRKKDLGWQAMSYGTCYVASVAMGANEAQTLHALEEAESFPGPALIIAYSQCIAHGIDMAHGMGQQKLAVESGAWLLYRYDPRRQPALQLDSKPPSRPVSEYLASEQRFRLVDAEQAQAFVSERFRAYQDKAESGKSARSTDSARPAQAASSCLPPATSV